MVDDPVFAERWSEAYCNALADGLPLFGLGVPQATPVNAAPYVVDVRIFKADFGVSERRRQLLTFWQQGIGEARGLGFDSHLAVIGGSFLDLGNLAPNDLDCAVFYDGSAESRSRATGLQAVQRRMIENGVDVRFMPGDQSRLFLAKAIGYFMLLYTQQRGHGAVRAPLLVMLDDRRRDVAA